MSIGSMRYGETLTIVGVEELHALNWNSIMNEVARLLGTRQARIVEIDLSETRFIDCFGIDSLQALERLVRSSHGTFRVKNPSQSARSILATNGMQHLISFSIPMVVDPLSKVSWSNP